MKELVDTDGENRAVRMFLAHYGKNTVYVCDMCTNLRLAGYDGLWPEWVKPSDRAHLTKGGAQSWLRHLFSLEPAPERLKKLVDVERVAFIRGWDERGKAHELSGSEVTDRFLKNLMDICYPRGAKPVVTSQYYYRNSKCEAYNSSKGACICWHDEGTGPYPQGRAGLTWRNKP